MSFLIYIVFGGLVGWIASIIMKTDAQQGILLNIIIGIVGSIMGTWIFQFFGAGGVSGFNISSFIVAVVGSVVLIAIVQALRR